MNTLTHPERGDAEFVVEVVCDDPSHDERRVALLGWWTSPEGAVGFVEWLSDVDGVVQTPFGEKLAAERRSGGPVDLGGWSGTPREMDYATRYRFECVDCRTVVVRGDRMEKILESVRAAGVLRFTLRDLAE